LDLLAFDEKSIFDFFCFIWGDKGGLTLSHQIKQKKKKMDFSSKAKRSNVHNFLAAKNTVSREASLREHCAESKSLPPRGTKMLQLRTVCVTTA
jgi:hypothetical protein